MAPSHFLKMNFNIIFHLCLGLPSGFFPQVPLPKSCMHFSFPHACYTPGHLIFLDLITRIIFGDEDRSWNSSSCSLLHSPVTSSLLGPNIRLSTLFSNTLNLCSSFSVTGQVPHPHKRIDTIVVLYTLIFIFLDSKLEDKRFCIEWSALNFFRQGISSFMVFQNLQNAAVKKHHWWNSCVYLQTKF
jgi:hypothetical protein